MNIIAIMSLLAVWYEPAEGIKYHDAKKKQQAIEVVNVDVTTGTVVLRRREMVAKKDSDAFVVRYVLAKYTPAGVEEIEECVADTKSCKPNQKAAQRALEWGEQSAATEHERNRRLLLRVNNLYFHKRPQGRKSAGVIDTGDVLNHEDLRVGALVFVDPGTEEYGEEGEASLVVPDGGVSLVLNDERRFLWSVPKWTPNMGGYITGTAEAHCGATSCVVIASAVNDTGRGVAWQGVSVSPPIPLASPGLDFSTACKTKVKVSVVANPELSTTTGAHIVYALNKAGCAARGPDDAKARRTQNAVFAKDVADPAAVAIAKAIGVTTVEPLTWPSFGTVVVALGK